MINIGSNQVRERTRREAIDEMLLKLCDLARENGQGALRLQNSLLQNASPGQQTPERPARPGWLGEIADALESAIAHLEDTANVLEEVSRQVAPQTPAAMATKG